MAERRNDLAPIEDIDCDVPQNMTLREWRGGERPPAPTGRIRAAAAAFGRAARLRRRT
jgi:hypothetical protein